MNSHMMKDIGARRKLVWDIDKTLQEDAARPVRSSTRPRAAPAGGPASTASRSPMNTIYNHWRFEDVWLDQ